MKQDKNSESDVRKKAVVRFIVWSATSLAIMVIISVIETWHEDGHSFLSFLPFLPLTIVAGTAAIQGFSDGAAFVQEKERQKGVAQ